MAGLRAASSEDVDEIARLLDAKRREYETYSPVFWRPAADAITKHKLFLEALITQGGPITLVQPGDDGLDGVIVALRRSDDWLVDDFAVRSPERWTQAGRALLDEVCTRADGVPVTVVCGHRDEPKRALLHDGGGVLREQWWVRALAGVEPDSDSDPALAAGAVGRLLTAPPVYDPGGPVCQARAWDGSRAALEGLERWARSQGAVLVVVPVGAGDGNRQEVLRDVGYHVASDWYEVRPPNR